MPASMVYAETLLEPKFAADANLPEGSTVTEDGVVPVAAGVPLTAVDGRSWL